MNADFHLFIVRAVDSALMKEINASLHRQIDSSPTLHISQAVQFSINAAALHDACEFVENYIQSFDATGQLANSNNIMQSTTSNLSVMSPTAVSSSPVSSASSSSSRVVHLSARESFQQTRIRCEDLLFELIDAKIDQFLQLTSNIEWSELQSIPT